jgi:hypothetical protein
MLHQDTILLGMSTLDCATNAANLLSCHNQSEIVYLLVFVMLMPNQTINEVIASAIESRLSAFNIKLLLEIL